MKNHITDWYHITLFQAEFSRTEENIAEFLFWPSIRDKIADCIQA
jgi:hypothetical protein